LSKDILLLLAAIVKTKSGNEISWVKEIIAKKGIKITNKKDRVLSAQI
jgi:hypothetical protein